MSSQAELKNRLKVLLGLPENQYCVDCNDGQPRCASLIVPPPGAPTNTPIGALCCLECSGPHRKLGAHVASVRSISLDTCKYAWVFPLVVNFEIYVSFGDHKLELSQSECVTFSALPVVTDSCFASTLHCEIAGNDNEVYSLETWGNTKVNALFEARLPRINDKPITTAKGGTRERFIWDKYERRRFYDEGVFMAIEREEHVSDRRLQQPQHNRSRRNIFNDSFEVPNAKDIDWASNMFSGQAAVPMEPVKARVTDDSLFSESTDFSDFESDGGAHRQRRRHNGRGVKVNEFDTDSSERSKKARSVSNRATPQINGQLGSVVPCFQLDSNKSNSWGVSIDDADDDFEPSEFELEASTTDDSCGLRARQKLISLQNEESKMTAVERKAAKTVRRNKRRAIRTRKMLEIEGSESDDEMNSHDYPKDSRKKTFTKNRRGTTTTRTVSNTSSSSKASPLHHEKTAPRRILTRQHGSERSLSTSSSGGSKDSAKSNSGAEKKLNPTLLEGVLEESNSETVDDDQRGRGSSRSRSTGSCVEKARGRSHSRDPDMTADKERSQSRLRKQDRSVSRSQNHSRSQSRRRETSRSRSSENSNPLKKTSLLGYDDSDTSDNETGLLRKADASTSVSTQPRRGKPVSSSPTKNRAFSPRKQEEQRNTYGTCHKNDEQSQDSFDPFAGDFSTLARKSDSSEFSGQRVRRATLNFGQSCLDHATNSGCSTNGNAGTTVPASIRRASAALGAGPGPALRPPSTDDNLIKNKIVPPKHDKAVDNLLKSRRLRGAEPVPAPTQSSSTKGAYKAAFSKFQK